MSSSTSPSCPARPCSPPPRYTSSSPSSSSPSSVTIVLSCPKVSSLSTILTLYTLTMSTIVSCVSLIWTICHLVILINTQEQSLRQQRYVDIFSGVCLLSSQLCLGFGSIRRSTLLVGLYFTLCCGLLVIYWIWFVYLKYAIMDPIASKQVSQFLTIGSILHILLLIPVIPYFKLLDDLNNKRPRDKSKEEHCYTISQSQMTSFENI